MMVYDQEVEQWVGKVCYAQSLMIPSGQLLYECKVLKKIPVIPISYIETGKLAPQIAALTKLITFADYLLENETGKCSNTSLHRPF